MKRIVAVSSLLLSSLFVLPAGAQFDPANQSDPANPSDPNDPARLFPREASIVLPDSSSTSAMHRIELPAEVLETTRGDLSDLRIHDANGTDVAFLVSSSMHIRQDLRTYSLVPESIERQVEDADSANPSWRETLTVVPPLGVLEGRWQVRIDSARRTFVREIVVRQRRGPDEEPVEIARASIFRLQDPLRERLVVELPRMEDLRPTLELEMIGEGGYIEPGLQLEVTRAPFDPPVLSMPLEEISRERRDGRTIIELARPSGIVPGTLRLNTTTGHFHREVRVYDLAQGRDPHQLASVTIFRLREIEGAEDIEVRLGRTRGERLRVEIEDGDSPELAEIHVEVQLRQPTVLFEPGSRSLWLRFGGGRARLPRYDLEGLRFAWIDGRRAGDLPVAELADLRDNPHYDARPALHFAMQAGRAPEVARYTHVADLTVDRASEGLSRVRLPASVLSAARGDLADLRIVDAEGRQWPYLRANDERDTLEAELAAPEIESDTSRYVIELPVDFATVEQLELETSAEYVYREFELFGLDEHERRVSLLESHLTRDPDEAGRLVVEFPPTRVSRLELVVEDGSDASLSFDGAHVVVPSPTLFLAAPDGAYRVLVGDADAEPPEYEVAAARELILLIAAAEAEIGEATANPAHVSPPWYETSDWHAWLLWAVLLLTMLILGLLTVRVARADPEDEPGPVVELSNEETSSEEASDEAPSEAGPAGEDDQGATGEREAAGEETSGDGEAGRRDSSEEE